VFKSKLCFAAIALATSSLITLTSSPAQATGGCVTHREFRRVHIGSTIPEVRAILGAHGRVTETHTYVDGNSWKAIGFRRCGESWSDSYISFAFNLVGHDENGTTVWTEPYVLTAKSALWH